TNISVVRSGNRSQVLATCVTHAELNSPSNMDLNTKKTISQSLLSCGNGGGLSEKLLLKPGVGRSLQTERVPRSSVLERLQSFLPRMAEANEKLKQQLEEAPEGHFDIQNVDEAERVIEMDVAVVELNESGSESEEEEETSESESESEEDVAEITERNLKLPGNRGNKKASIQVLEQGGE
ncbi:NOP protein chaperone 1, partial [Xiphophorus hellerii]|uniref:NOP protein chaperone 1 n=1 Tax=Xiphophorus hellerii TaxID=8084 RepID=UPI0013B45D0A